MKKILGETIHCGIATGKMIDFDIEKTKQITKDYISDVELEIE